MPLIRNFVPLIRPNIYPESKLEYFMVKDEEDEEEVEYFMVSDDVYFKLKEEESN